MIAFTTIGTNDMPRCQAFYDALLGEIGGNRAMEIPRVTLWAGADGTPFFGAAEPADGHDASCGNGTMIALGAPSAEDVDRLHAKAIELGAQDEGAPGPRQNGDLKFYSGYFRDPDGNKLSFFHM